MLIFDGGWRVQGGHAFLLLKDDDWPDFLETSFLVTALQLFDRIQTCFQLDRQFLNNISISSAHVLVFHLEKLDVTLLHIHAVVSNPRLFDLRNKVLD